MNDPTPTFRTTVRHTAKPGRSPKEPPRFEATTAATPMAFGRRIETLDRSYVVGESGQLLRAGSGWRGARKRAAANRGDIGKEAGRARVETAIKAREAARERRKAAKSRG